MSITISPRSTSRANELSNSKLPASTARLEARISTELHALLERAAEIQGRTICQTTPSLVEEVARAQGVEITLEKHGLRSAAQTFDWLTSATPEAVQQGLTSGQPTILDLGARSCIPCKKMAPILGALAETYRERAHVLFIDLHEDQDAIKTWRIQMYLGLSLTFTALGLAAGLFGTLFGRPSRTS
jgi:thiol-disulfide isomerase/thioredoxin